MIDPKVFHDHLDVCKQCRNQPFNLCPVGHSKIKEATMVVVRNEEMVFPTKTIPASRWTAFTQTKDVAFKGITFRIKGGRNLNDCWVLSLLVDQNSQLMTTDEVGVPLKVLLAGPIYLSTMNAKGRIQLIIENRGAEEASLELALDGIVVSP